MASAFFDYATDGNPATIILEIIRFLYVKQKQDF